MVDELPTNFVYSIAVSPAFAQDGIIFAAQQSGLYRSVDSGKSWQTAYKSLAQEIPLATHAVASLRISVTIGQFSRRCKEEFCAQLTVGTAGRLIGCPHRHRWRPVCWFPLIIRLTVKLFCATVEDGVFISRDRGLHWASWNFGLLDLQILCLAISPQFAQDQTLMVGTESGIFLSKNGGRAWKAVDFPVGSAPVTSLGFSMAYEVDSIIFAGTVMGNSSGLLTEAAYGGASLMKGLTKFLLAITLNAIQKSWCLKDPGYIIRR